MSDSAEKDARIQENARNIVDLLLESARPKHMELPIKIRHPDGAVSDSVFTGYYPADMSPTGHPVPSVGYKTASGHFSHGMLRSGDQIVGHIPTFEEWERWMEQQQHQLQNVCAACEKEFGVRSAHRNVTHGTCKRHAIEQYQQMGADRWAHRIKEIQARPESEFAPDLAKLPPHKRGIPHRPIPPGRAQ